MMGKEGGGARGAKRLEATREGGREGGAKRREATREGGMSVEEEDGGREEGDRGGGEGL